MPLPWKGTKQMRPVQRELNGSHVITVEAGITWCVLECAKLSYLPTHSTACVVLLYQLLQIRKSNSITQTFHHSVRMLVHIRLTHSKYKVHIHRVFEAKGRRDKGVIIKFSDVRSLYPKQGITDAVIDYYVRYIN